MKEPSHEEPPIALTYDRRDPVDAKPRMRRPLGKKLTVGLVACALLLFVVALWDGIATAFVLGAAVSTVAFIIWQYRWMKRNPSEEEFEKEWERQESERKEMLEVAKKIYEKMPFGSWRYIDCYIPKHASPTVIEERAMTIDSNGKGTYHRSRREPALHVSAIFEIAPETIREDTFSVRLLSPYVEELIEVQYGFTVAKNVTGGEDLLIWFESDNPLQLEQQDFWPFYGEFSREMAE